MKKLFLLFFLSFYAFFAPATFAQTSLRESGCLLKNTSVATFECLPVLFANVVLWLLIFVGIVATAFVVFSGFKFVTSAGDAKKTEGARKTLTFAIIGLILVLFSFFIVRLIGQTTGLACLSTNGLSFDSCVPNNLRGRCSDRNPNGICPRGQACLRSGGSDSFECKKVCGGNQRGHCDSGTCKRLGGPDGNPEYGCR
jgi:hypothetical protein